MNFSLGLMDFEETLDSSQLREGDVAFVIYTGDDPEYFGLIELIVVNQPLSSTTFKYGTAFVVGQYQKPRITDSVEKMDVITYAWEDWSIHLV